MKLEATHIGEGHINDELIQYDVLYVSTFKYNLIYVTKLTNYLGCKLFFSAKNCVIQDGMTKKMIGLAEVCNGPYHLNIDAGNAVVTSNVFGFVAAYNK